MSADLAAELHRLYPSDGRGRPRGRPNVATINAAICARRLRAQGLVGWRLGEAVAEFVGRDTRFTDEQLASAEGALADALGRGLSIDVPAPVAPLSAARARRAQALLDRHLELAQEKITTPEQLLSYVVNYAQYLRAIERPAFLVDAYESVANDLRVRLEDRTRLEADALFERDRANRQLRIRMWRPLFEITAQNTVREHETASGRVTYRSISLEPCGVDLWRVQSGERYWRWRWRRDQWQLAEIGEACGREAMEKLAVLQRSQRNNENRRNSTLSVDYAYETDSNNTTLLDYVDGNTTVQAGGSKATKVDRAAEVICEELGDGHWHLVRPIRERLRNEGLAHPQTVTDAKRHISGTLPCDVTSRQHKKTVGMAADMETSRRPYRQRIIRRLMSINLGEP